ncbi:LuxR family transcriptional regulator [Prescottella agglutinans]|uniref:LuxR family transcriptional regulator n=1 Tax=Prescottella agglutinans TaxID=1644129 RepID=A0A438BBY9_9NOCA|nr:helix-turn-helix transcriptional regulator [Prescottella agglutinans]RVW08371.1 LuxR family transcriptional regulator [Prescottella agglutinans]
MTSRKVEPLRASVCDAALGSADVVEFRHAVLDAIRARIPYDVALIATVDPATLLPTSQTTIGVDPVPRRAVETAARLEHGPPPYGDAIGKLARKPVGVETIRDALGEDLRRTLPYAEILEPLGMDDELRFVLRGRDGRCWGCGTVMRGPGRRFSREDVRLLAGAVRSIGDGLRLSLIRQAPRVLAEVPGGPSVVILGSNDEVESATASALAYLDRISDESETRMVPALFAAERLRNSGAAAAVTRARTLDGEWVVIRAGKLDGRGTAGRVAVTLEPAGPGEIVSLLAAIHGLTAREAEVLDHILAGMTRVEVAHRLFVSPYTVQDHLKSIYAKIGVNSRQELVAQLFFAHYLPRFNSPVGPDGWFA